VTTQELAEQSEMAESRFGGKELGRQDFAGGVVSCMPRAVSRGPRPWSQSWALHEFSQLGGAHAALTMSGRTALSGRAETGLAQETAEHFAAEGDAPTSQSFAHR
jgi:hypothetical protein